MRPLPAAAPILGHHRSAHRCRDAEDTRRLYEDLLDLPPWHIIQSNDVPSTGECWPYAHIFVRMGDGSCVAFFDELLVSTWAAPSDYGAGWVVPPVSTARHQYLPKAKTSSRLRAMKVAIGSVILQIHR